MWGMDAFAALADPTRRQILELLGERERSAGELARQFRISRPAVSRHLRVLREAGLARPRGEAQRRIYRIEPAALAEVDAWVGRYRRFWSDGLDRLEQHLDDEEERHDVESDR